MDEDNTPAVEVPSPPAVLGENPPPAAPPAPLDPSAPAPPPAASLVLNGERSEREIQLERDLESEREGRRRAEVIGA